MAKLTELQIEYLAGLARLQGDRRKAEDAARQLEAWYVRRLLLANRKTQEARR